jgi:hypothetical protein
MMAPYEAESLFEVEMARQHQYEDDLYCCKSRRGQDSLSLRALLRDFFFGEPAIKPGPTGNTTQPQPASPPN